LENALKSLITPARLLKYAAFLTFSIASCAHAVDAKIGFVTTERILREANLVKVASAKIEQEFSRRDKDIQEMGARLKSLSEKFDKDGPTLSESERLKRQRELIELDKDVQRKQREFREDFNQRQNEERAMIFERASKVIKQIAESEKYDIILQDAIYWSPSVDITDKVLKALNK
jgi:outer membrane protein